jgi:HEAT repeats
MDSAKTDPGLIAPRSGQTGLVQNGRLRIMWPLFHWTEGPFSTDGTMNSNRSWTRYLGAVLAIGFVCSIAYLLVTGGFHWWTLRGMADSASSGEGRDVVVEALLTNAEASRVRELVRQLMNPGDSNEAAAQLRDHFDDLARNQPDRGAPSMAFFLQCLAPRFSSMDTPTRQLSLAMMSDIFGWFGQNTSPCWIALLGPSGTILSASLADPSTDVNLASLQIIHACWDWAPPEVKDTGHRKALGTWKAELHSRCVELLQIPNETVRAAAGVTVVSVPIDAAASRGLVLLHDERASVRRAVLIALSDRQELLANEDVVGFLRDSSSAVRTSAETVLTSRGLNAEQIALAKRATDPSPLVRAQAPRHVVESNAVDRIVWLRHLSQDVAAAVRAEAARALAMLGTEECLERLDQMAQEDPDTQVRQLASNLRGGFGTASRQSNAETSEESTETLPIVRVPRAN